MIKSKGISLPEEGWDDNVFGFVVAGYSTGGPGVEVWGERLMPSVEVCQDGGRWMQGIPKVLKEN